MTFNHSTTTAAVVSNSTAQQSAAVTPHSSSMHACIHSFIHPFTAAPTTRFRAEQQARAYATGSNANATLTSVFWLMMIHGSVLRVCCAQSLWSRDGQGEKEGGWCGGKIGWTRCLA